jgi:tetratricopeptide (TPR) repeat protein
VRRVPPLLLLAGLGLCVIAAAAGATPVLGEPWEDAIERGLAKQRQEQRSRPADALTGNYERTARRDPSVVNLYLLGRAYGLRAAAYAEQAAAAKAGPERERFADLARRDRGAARRTYEEVLGTAPRCYFALHDLGVLALQEAPPNETVAFGHFEKVYQLHPRFTPTLRQLVNLYIVRKRYDAAVTLLRTILQVEPEDNEGRLKLAGLLAELNQVDSAYAEVDQVLARNRNDVRALLAQAQIDLQAGRLERAGASFRRLAAANPGATAPFLGLLRTAQLRREQAPDDRAALEDALTAFKGLHRLEREPTRREELAKSIQDVERALAAPLSSGGGPPTVAQALAILERPEEDARAQALLYLMLRDTAPTEAEQREMLKAIAGRVTQTGEPSPKVRAVAVSAIGRLYGTAWMWVTRQGLRDPDGRVVAHAADTLVGIARRDSDALGAAVAALALHVDAPSVEGASACRLGILDLVGASLVGLAEDASDEEQRSAFRAWWSSAVGEDRLVESLRAYPRARDPHGHQVLLPHLDSASTYVARAAFDALGGTAAFVREPELQAWYARRPVIPEGTPVTPASWEGVRAQVQAWARSCPLR